MTYKEYEKRRLVPVKARRKAVITLAIIVITFAIGIHFQNWLNDYITMTYDPLYDTDPLNEILLPMDVMLALAYLLASEISSLMLVIRILKKQSAKIKRLAAVLFVVTAAIIVVSGPITCIPYCIYEIVRIVSTSLQLRKQGKCDVRRLEDYIANIELVNGLDADVLFENTYVRDGRFEEGRDLIGGRMKKPAVIFAIALFAILNLIPAIRGITSVQYCISMFIFVGVVIGIFVGGSFYILKRTAGLYFYEDYEMTTIATESYMQFVKLGQVSKKVSYDNVTRIAQSKKYLFLYYEKTLLTVLKKDSFAVGDTVSFLDLVLAKNSRISITT